MFVVSSSKEGRGEREEERVQGGREVEREGREVKREGGSTHVHVHNHTADVSNSLIRLSSSQCAVTVRLSHTHRQHAFLCYAMLYAFIHTESLFSSYLSKCLQHQDMMFRCIIVLLYSGRTHIAITVLSLHNASIMIFHVQASSTLIPSHSFS